METCKKQGEYHRIKDYFADIYPNVTPSEDFPNSTKNCRALLPHHFKELTEGSGLHLTTLARTGVRSISDPDYIYHILSRHNKIDPADLKAIKTTQMMSRDGKPIMAFLNPLMPDEAHSKKDGFTYMAARGSCKPPLIWAPQAKVTDFNRPWLVEKYGEEVVNTVAANLTNFQKKEQDAIKQMFIKNLEQRGFSDRSEAIAQIVFSHCGFEQHYQAIEDSATPVEITEGQKKMYCMAQAKEFQIFENSFGFLDKLDALQSLDTVETKARGLQSIKPALFVCTPGVWLIVSKNPTKDKDVKYVLNDSWKSIIDLSGRDIVMTWDADAAYNPEVANAAQWTGWAMKREFPGCTPHWRLYDEDVRIEKQDGTPVKLGADDLITHFGPASFFDLPACKIATGIPRSQMIAEANKLSEEQGKKVNYIGYLEQKQLQLQDAAIESQNTFGF